MRKFLMLVRGPLIQYIVTKRRYIARGGILRSVGAISLIKPREDAVEGRESIEHTHNFVKEGIQAVESIAQSRGAFEEEVALGEPRVKTATTKSTI